MLTMIDDDVLKSVLTCLKGAPLKDFADKLVNCPQDDLITAIDSIDYKCSEWKKSTVLQWVDVLNRFDSILEQTIAKSSLLQIGKKKDSSNKQDTPSKKVTTGTTASLTSQKTTPTSSKDVDFPQEQLFQTPEPTLILRILQFSAFLLRTVKQKTLYSSMEVSGDSDISRLTLTFFYRQHISCLMLSENIEIVCEAVNILYEYVKREPVGYSGRLSFPSGYKTLDRALLLAHGYGPASITTTCRDVELEASVSIKLK